VTAELHGEPHGVVATGTPELLAELWPFVA
jgi:hypothetical protein